MREKKFEIKRNDNGELVESEFWVDGSHVDEKHEYRLLNSKNRILIRKRRWISSVLVEEVVGDRHGYVSVRRWFNEDGDEEFRMEYNYVYDSFGRIDSAVRKGYDALGLNCTIEFNVIRSSFQKIGVSKLLSYGGFSNNGVGVQVTLLSEAPFIQNFGCSDVGDQIAQIISRAMLRSDAL